MGASMKNLRILMTMLIAACYASCAGPQSGSSRSETSVQNVGNAAALRSMLLSQLRSSITIPNGFCR